jgi:hypothetical protein
MYTLRPERLVEPARKVAIQRAAQGRLRTPVGHASAAQRCCPPRTELRRDAREH